MREHQHDLRGICMFNKQLVRTNAKYCCFITVKLINLVVNTGAEMKIFMFNITFIDKKGYMCIGIHFVLILFQIQELNCT